MDQHGTIMKRRMLLENADKDFPCRIGLKCYPTRHKFPQPIFTFENNQGTGSLRAQLKYFFRETIYPRNMTDRFMPTQRVKRIYLLENLSNFSLK